MAYGDERSEELRRAQSMWAHLKTKYGDFQYIDDPSDLPNVDKKRIWTEFWSENQFIVNKFEEVEEFDDEITSYFVFERPCEEVEGSLTVLTTLWIDCECEGEEDECESCSGAGSIPIELV
jgi:hypothetical protein